MLSSAFTNVSKADTAVKIRNMLALGDEKLFKVLILSHLGWSWRLPRHDQPVYVQLAAGDPADQWLTLCFH